MENIKDLELSEMLNISGGVNLAYEIGYTVGSFIKKFTILRTIVQMI